MDRFKIYTLGLVSLVVSIYIILLLTCLYLEPPVGDTTRVSGYSENDFGWNIPQKTFTKEATPLQEEYDHYVDVLVVGDSFSFGGVLEMMNYPWQTYLTANSGLSVSTFSHYTTKTNPPSYDPSLIPRIVNSETFKKTPPKVFVLEVVERQLNILPKIEGDCKLHHDIERIPNLEIKPIPSLHPTIDLFRNKQRPPLHKRFAYAVKYYESFLSFLGHGNQAYLFSLVSDKLFSSNKSDTLLVYEGDVKKKNWNTESLDNMTCILKNIQNLVQANEKTILIIMIAPDKLSAYSPYLKDADAKGFSVIERFSKDQSLHSPRFDLALQSAIKNGAVDLYLPNDTHWASQGQKIAADTLTKYLIDLSRK